MNSGDSTCAASSRRFSSPQAGATLRYTAGPSPAPYHPRPKPSPFVVSTPMREWRLWSTSPCGGANSSSSMMSGCPDHAIQRHIALPPLGPTRHVRAALLADPLAEADQRGVRRDLPGHQRLALAEGHRALDQARRDEREHAPDVREVGRGVHPHQDEVVALREHVLVHLLRPLGDEDQVQPELAPLPRDPDRVLRGERRDRPLRLRRAHVVGLVYHERDRLARRATAPEPLEHVPCRDRLLLAPVQRAQVHDEAAWPARVLELLRKRAAVGTGPDAPAVDAEVVRSQPERIGGLSLHVGERAHALVLDRGRELRILLAVHQGIEAKGRRLLLRAQLAEPHPYPVLAGDAAAHRHRAGDLPEALRRGRVGPRPRLTDPYV